MKGLLIASVTFLITTFYWRDSKVASNIVVYSEEK